MTTEELQKFSNLLNEEESRIRNQLSQVALKDPATNSYQPKPGNVDSDPDEEDIMRDTTETENNMAVESELKPRLDEIHKAQEKIKDGTYGTCERCGSPIESDRLQAFPATSYCSKCAD